MYPRLVTSNTTNSAIDEPFLSIYGPDVAKEAAKSIPTAMKRINSW